MMACGPAQHQNTHLKHPLNVSDLNRSLRTQHPHLIHPYSTPYISLTHIHLTHPSTSSLNPLLFYPLPTLYQPFTNLSPILTFPSPNPSPNPTPTLHQPLTYPHPSLTQPLTQLLTHPFIHPSPTRHPTFTNPSRILTLHPTPHPPFTHPPPSFGRRQNEMGESCLVGKRARNCFHLK